MKKYHANGRAARAIRSAVCTGLCAALFLGCTACSGGAKTPEQPVTISLWHVYGAQTDSPLNDMIDIFNQTAGKEQGIRVEVPLVSNNKTIHEFILASAYGDPGASELPDMFVAYPKTVLAMPDDGVLVDYRETLSEEALSGFVPSFLEEGMVNGRLAVLPLAKSTEVMYINKTIFDRFSADTGVAIGDLDTWEGLFAAAVRYAEWTDALTPEVAGDAKALLVHDFHFNYFQVGVESLGEAFFDGESIAFGPAFDRVWDAYAEAALAGGLWLQGGYATEPLRTADAIVSVASSASVLYFSDVVTYPDNTSEDVEWLVRPCPVFAGGERMVMQRGAGICTVKSTPERERACMIFLEWLTDAQRNTELATQLGYMPVRQASFDTDLPAAIRALESDKYIQLYEAFLQTQREYTFYIPPQLEGYLDVEERFEDAVRSALLSGRSQYLRGSVSLEDASQRAKAELMAAFSAGRGGEAG